MRRLLIPLLAVAALAAACGDWRVEDAATVDGRTVTMDELRHEVDVLAEHPDVAAAFQVDVSASGEDGGEASEQADTLVAWLNRRIADLVIDEELELRGLAVGDEARQRASTSLRYQLGLFGEQASQGGQAVAPLDQFENLPDDLQSALVEREAAREVLAASLTAEGEEPVPATAEQWFASHEGDYERYCVSIIVAEDEAHGEALLERLAAGEDFAALAAAESLDPATAARGGDADCARAGELSEELRSALGAAEPGEVVGPIELAGGWLLIELTSIEPPSFADAEDAAQVDRLNARQAALNEWLQETSPSVTVAPRLGTWDAEMFRVQPNTGPLRPDEPVPPSGGLP